MINSVYVLSQNIEFKTPMPPTNTELSTIPIEFFGTYCSSSFNELLEIRNNNITIERETIKLIKVSELEDHPICTLADDGLYFSDTRECIPYDFIGENEIRFIQVIIDTLFCFNNNEILKTKNNDLYLNTKNQSGGWSTTIISMISNGSIKMISGQTDIAENAISKLTTNYFIKYDDDKNVIFFVYPSEPTFYKMIQGASLFKTTLFTSTKIN